MGDHEVKKHSVEEELIVSDSAWQVLLSENLIVVNACSEIVSTIPVEILMS